MNRLQALEADGYAFQISGDNLAVKGSNVLLNPHALAQIRKQKPELMEALLLRNFCRSVRTVGVHGYDIVLDDDVIQAELSADDIEFLHHCNREDRQAWAELLAFRLADQRLRPD